MALTSAQIVTLACQIAKAPGYTSQAGELLNMILGDLCQTYEFDVTKRLYSFDFNPGVTAEIGPSIYGSGPYALPLDFLRCANDNAVWWTLLGVTYFLTPIDLDEFDAAVQQAGIQSYPYWFAVDMSPLDSAQQGVAGDPPVAYIYPPPSGAFPCFVRYFCQMPDIVTPETSTVVPWFPNQAYLKTRLAGEIMQITDDERAPVFLGDGPSGAQGILTRYLKLKDNQSNRAQVVKLDKRRFGRRFSTLKNTKTVGW
jgi:hypothetical protein